MVGKVSLLIYTETVITLQIMTLLFFLALSLILFFPFSCLTEPAWTCSTLLNWTSNNGHLCFTLNPTGNAFNVNRYFGDTFIRLRKFPSIPSKLRVFCFFLNDVEFYQKVFCSFWDNQVIFFFLWMAQISLNALVDILMLSQPCIPGIKSKVVITQFSLLIHFFFFQL